MRPQQILERDAHTLLRLFAFDAAGEPGGIHGHRMHGHVADQFVHESLTALAAFLPLGALDAMRQLHDGDHREPDLSLSIRGVDLFENPPHGVALPLAGDHHAGIQD
jgi:hypothetical protein